MATFYKHPEGETIIPYEIPVHIPPVGYVWDYFIGDWASRPIYSRSEDPKDQYWERPVSSFNYDQKRVLEKRKQEKNELYVDPELDEFRYTEWDRRINGFWFMNNGVPTYLTGIHYFYLTWWRIDIGYPSYRQSDRDFFYMWKYCEDDPKCFGLIEAARRRSGKTYRATVILFEEVSRRSEANAGMQSKKDEDAAIVFSKLVQAFSQLPDFFKPNFNDRSGPKPKNRLEFSPVQRQVDNIKPELSGKIDYQANDILAYDSQKLIRYLNDECGKNTKVDVSIGWSIARECLRLGVSQIVGKAFYTTTIEEGGSDNFRKLWDSSDFNDKDEITGGTSTGLYRTFTPAYKNVDDFVDRYGICDEVAAKEAMVKERAAKKTNRDRAEYIRKYPFDITEAFYSINEDCIYDSLKINNQAKLLDVKGKTEWYTVGNLQWQNGEIGDDVVFIPNINGRWKINNDFIRADEATPGGLTNKFQKIGGKFHPLSDNTAITGADTFDHSRKNLSDERQASDAAFYTFWRHDPLAPELDDTFVCEYIYRQPDADLMAEDLAMQCCYFGTPAVIENNKPGAIMWFDRNGLKPFIVKVDKREGISGSTKNKQSMAEVTEAYINDHIEKVVFHKLLSDWNNFSLEHSTAYDAAMGSGWALLIATRIGKKFQQIPQHLHTERSTGSNIYSKYL